jgi:hypothetical protein
MQKFQRRLFYAPFSSEDNAVIENFRASSPADGNPTSRFSSALGIELYEIIN